jgi:hypothetical protein
MNADALQGTLFMLMGAVPPLVMTGYILGSLRQDWWRDLSLTTLSKFLFYPPSLMRPERRKGFWIWLVVVATCWTVLLIVNRFIVAPAIERQHAERELLWQERRQ